ncbi:hypothetical protein [Micromonospora luteifusca]
MQATASSVGGNQHQHQHQAGTVRGTSPRRRAAASTWASPG